MNTKLAQLQERLGKIYDVHAAVGVLGWDQQTYMPAGGAAARAQQKATLTAIAHEWLVADETGRLLEDLETELAGLDYDSYEASLLRVARRHYDRQTKLPSKLVADLARATGLAQPAWGKARAQADFASFAPHLSEILDLTRQKAEALGYQDRIYDPLLDHFEPQLKTTQVEVLFSELRDGLVPLVRAIAGRQDAIDDSFLCEEFDEEKQWAFGLEVIKRLGFDFAHGRQDRAVHPFTSSFSPSDVRLTTRVSADNLRMALFATIHEAGHGMYDQGFDRAFDRTPLSDATSMGMHESQSRLWENMVGRSRRFWTFWLPRLKDYFPRQLEGIGVEAFYRAVNRVQPTLIRVEADEVTYNLHIMLRFEIENLMVEGKVAVSDLPELWNTRMREYLGLEPPSDREGVLQDVHWSLGYIGYFPTYTLGNLLAAQFYNQAVSMVPAIPDQIEHGEFSALFAWMREKIHTPGAKYTPVEHVRRVTGGPLQTGPFLDYIRQKYAEIYDL
jgi:carboxypeptidase Taq